MYKIRVSDNAPAHTSGREDIAPFSLAHAVRPHTFTNRCVHTEQASYLSPYFSLIALLKVKIREKIVEASHYNRMPSVARCFSTSLPFKPPIHTPLSDCERGGSTLISPYAKYISQQFISNSCIRKKKDHITVWKKSIIRQVEKDTG